MYLGRLIKDAAPILEAEVAGLAAGADRPCSAAFDFTAGDLSDQLTAADLTHADVILRAGVPVITGRVKVCLFAYTDALGCSFYTVWVVCRAVNGEVLTAVSAATEVPVITRRSLGL